jgi:hypothetical protein
MPARKSTTQAAPKASTRRKAQAPSIADLQRQLEETQAALEVAQQHSDDAASSVKDAVQDPDKVSRRESRKAMLATLAAEAGSVLVRDQSLRKQFTVAADPQYSRYMTVIEHPNGRTRRVPTSVVLDIIENPDAYKAAVAASLGRQVEALRAVADAEEQVEEQVQS